MAAPDDFKSTDASWDSFIESIRSLSCNQRRIRLSETLIDLPWKLSFHLGYYGIIVSYIPGVCWILGTPCGVVVFRIPENTAAGIIIPVARTYTTFFRSGSPGLYTNDFEQWISQRLYNVLEQ